MRPEPPADLAQWRRVEAILDLALDLPPKERVDLLDQACAGDPELRSKVEALLAADKKAGSFLGVPPANTRICSARVPASRRTRRTSPVARWGRTGFSARSAVVVSGRATGGGHASREARGREDPAADTAAIAGRKSDSSARRGPLRHRPSQPLHRPRRRRKRGAALHRPGSVRGGNTAGRDRAGRCRRQRRGISRSRWPAVWRALTRLELPTATSSRPT